MSTPKHTPGPWKAISGNFGGKFADISIRKATEHKFKGPVIGWVNIRHPQDVDGPANALLFAAAPRMAKALQRAAHLLAELPDQSPQMTALRAEIVDTIKEATPEHYGYTSPEGKFYA